MVGRLSDKLKFIRKSGLSFHCYLNEIKKLKLKNGYQEICNDKGWSTLSSY